MVSLQAFPSLPPRAPLAFLYRLIIIIIIIIINVIKPGLSLQHKMLLLMRALEKNK